MYEVVSSEVFVFVRVTNVIVEKIPALWLFVKESVDHEALIQLPLDQSLFKIRYRLFYPSNVLLASQVLCFLIVSVLKHFYRGLQLTTFMIVLLDQSDEGPQFSS